MKKVLKTTLMALIMVCTVFSNAYAHSGRTDAYGGHKDNKNKSGLGPYHYHCGGYPAHLHTNGCPYTGAGVVSTPKETKDTITISNAPSSLQIGEQCDLSYSITGSGKSSGTWKSSDSSVIAVTSTGSLSAKGIGSATVTLSTNNNSQSFTVTVTPIEVTSVGVSESSAEIQINKSKKITATVLPSNASNKTVTWRSDDENIAYADADGTIHAVACGETKIYAVSNNNISKEVSVKVYTILPESIELTNEKFNVEMTKNFQIEAKVMPENADYQGITFECDNTDVAVVNEKGVITPVSLGNANITITAGAISRTVPVEVFEVNAESIKIIKDSEDFLMGNYMDVSKAFALNAETNPGNATYKDFTWTSSNPEVIAVTSGNEFFAAGEGKATITVRNEEGVEASIEITVAHKGKVYGAGFGGIFALGGVGSFIGWKKGILNKELLKKFKKIDL